ncbi:immunity 49 family protein [Kitasatospora sp. NPDC097643]|uniref:immunity 49 family protein n=1 Tax=Kitasatospora sp. NPDC097643 TaxID=3157230 RepID=UPI0033311B18
MHIERHQVDESAISAAREDFANRIGRQVHSYSRVGLMTTTEWQLIADAFLDHLGALSASHPALDSPEARAVLKDATEAAVGAVSFAAYYPVDSFHVFLDYPDFGMGYESDHSADRDPVHGVTPQQWIDALCLAILSDTVDRHGEAFVFARQLMPDAPDSAARALVDGFAAHVLNDTDLPPDPDDRQPGLQALRALAAADRDSFDAALLALLRAPHGSRPSSLLPLLPLALSALAHRTHGWAPPCSTDYLPRALVTGFETAGPRVHGLGRDPRPEALAQLAAGPLLVDRPGEPFPLHPDGAAWFEQRIREAISPAEGRTVGVSALASALGHQKRLFNARASQSDDVTDAQLAALRLASQLGAALFRIALAEPGTEAEVVIDGRTLRCPATRDHNNGPGHWQLALDLALITGVRADLAPLVLAGPAHSAGDRSAYASYRVALHDYLRGVDPLPATERALRDVAKAEHAGFLPPPTVLFSQLVEGDETSFNLALADALEAHRDHHLVADRASDSDAALSLEVLALACHARRRGWTIRVRSPYLPPRLLRAAEPR